MEELIKIWFPDYIYIKKTQIKNNEFIIVQLPYDTIINTYDLEIGKRLHYSFYSMYYKEIALNIWYKKDAE